jgi:prevent-host-death family protein
MERKVLSKARFKPRMLEYLREVETTGQELVITDRGRPVVRIVPFESNHQHLLSQLRGTVTDYVDPTEPVADDDWEALDAPA